MQNWLKYCDKCPIDEVYPICRHLPEVIEIGIVP